MLNKEFYGTLTEKEKQYVCQIEYYSNEIPALSIHELAERIYTSPATLSRLVKKLGYSSYKAFKHSFITVNYNPQTDNNFLHTSNHFSLVTKLL